MQRRDPSGPIRAGRARPRRAGERGVFAVITAITMPFLVFLLFSMVEYGIAVLHLAEMQNMADAAAFANAYVALHTPNQLMSSRAINGIYYFDHNRGYTLDSDARDVNGYARTQQATQTQSPGSKPMAVGSLATIDDSRFAEAAARMRHTVLYRGGDAANRVAPATERTEGSALLSQLVWPRLSPVPVRIVLVLDFTQSMIAGLTPGGISALQRVTAAAKRIIQTDPRSTAGLINWGFYPYADNPQRSINLSIDPLECRLALVGQDAYDPAVMRAQGQQVIARIDALNNKPIGQWTDMAQAVTYLNSHVQRYPADAGCGDVVYVIITDGAPSAYDSDGIKAFGGTKRDEHQAQAALRTRQAINDAIDVATNGPREIKTLMIDRLTGDAGEAASLQAFLRSIACKSDLGCNLPANFRKASTDEQIDDIVTDGAFDYPIHCQGFGLKVPSGSWALPLLPGPIATGQIAANAFFTRPSITGPRTEYQAQLRRTRLHMDIDPSTNLDSDTYYSFFINANAPYYIETNTALCKRYYDEKNNAAFYLRLRWGIPILAD